MRLIKIAAKHLIHKTILGLIATTFILIIIGVAKFIFNFFSEAGSFILHFFLFGHSKFFGFLLIIFLAYSMGLFLESKLAEKLKFNDLFNIPIIKQAWAFMSTFKTVRGKVQKAIAIRMNPPSGPYHFAIISGKEDMKNGNYKVVVTIFLAHWGTAVSLYDPDEKVLVGFNNLEFWERIFAWGFAGKNPSSKNKPSLLEEKTLDEIISHIHFD